MYGHVWDDAARIKPYSLSYTHYVFPFFFFFFQFAAAAHQRRSRTCYRPAGEYDGTHSFDVIIILSSPTKRTHGVSAARNNNNYVSAGATRTPTAARARVCLCGAVDGDDDYDDGKSSKVCYT